MSMTRQVRCGTLSQCPIGDLSVRSRLNANPISFFHTLKCFLAGTDWMGQVSDDLDRVLGGYTNNLGSSRSWMSTQSLIVVTLALIRNALTIWSFLRDHRWLCAMSMRA